MINDDHSGAAQIVQTPLILVIGSNERDEFGGWENLTSSWLWQCFKSETINAAINLMSIANLKPTLVIFDKSYDDVDALKTDLQLLSKSQLNEVPIIVASDEINLPNYSDTMPAIRFIDQDFKASELRKAAEGMI